MRGQLRVQELASHGDALGNGIVRQVTDDDDALAAWSDEGDDRQSLTLVLRTIEHHAAAWLYEVGEMLYGVVLSGVAVLPRLRVNLYQRVLSPSPRALTVVAENEVPDEIFITTSPYIVGRLI